MAFDILFGEDVDASFLEKIVPIDRACYPKEYQGDLLNTVARYEKNRQSFVFAYDTEADRLAGYLNCFPCESGLYLDIVSRCPTIRDDDILPEEVAPFRPTENHLFILSFAIHPAYQDGEVVKLISNAFVDYLNRLQRDQGYPIADITAAAISPHGKKSLTTYLFRELRSLDDGNVVYICDGQRLRRLLSNRLYFKSYKDDLYLLIPLVEHRANLRMEHVFAASGQAAPAAASTCDQGAPSPEPAPSPNPVSDSAPLSGESPAGFDCGLASYLIDRLQEFIAYECSNEVAHELQFAHLGSYDFLHTTDEYAGLDDMEKEVVIGTARGHAVVVGHRKTHMYVLAVLLPSYPFSTSQMEDQVSFGYVKIRDPLGGSGFVNFFDYLLRTFGLHECRETKCVLYLSNKPQDPREFQDILAAEAFDNFGTDYNIASREIETACSNNRAQFDDYEAYLSSCAIAYVARDFSPDVFERVEDFADYLFVIILTLFQNTALAKVNMRVTEILESSSDIDLKVKLEIDREYGQSVRFWEMQNFKYMSTQMESACIREAFQNQQLRETYNEHQEYLDHLVSVKTAIVDGRNGMVINVVAIILAVMQVQPLFVAAIQSLYGALGIEATYAETTINYGFFGGVALFVLIVLINQCRHRYLQRGRM